MDWPRPPEFARLSGSESALQRDLHFGLVWAGSMLAFLSCVSFKRGDYLCPLLPGLAIFLGCATEQWLRSQSFRIRRWHPRLTAGLVLAVCAGWVGYEHAVVPKLDARQDHRRFAEAVRELAPGEMTFLRVENHELAFHLGQPVRTVTSWPELGHANAAIIPAHLAGELPPGYDIAADSRDFLDRPKRPPLLIRATEP